MKVKQNKITDFKPGTRVKIVANTAGHGAKIGSDATVLRVQGGYIYLKEFPSWCFYQNDLQIGAMTRDEIKKEIETLKLEIIERENQLEFMDETDSKEFDYDEFKIYHSLKVIEGKGSRIEKARALRAIINGS